MVNRNKQLMFVCGFFQMPHANLFDIYETPRETNNTSSTSCPAKFAQATPPQFMTEEEARLWQKDRQKKDNHNQSKRLCW